MTRAVDIEGRGVRVNGRSVGVGVGVGSAIPDSALDYHETPISGLSNGDSVSSWPNQASSADFSLSGPTYNEGAFSDGQDAISGDGSDDTGTAPWSNLGSWQVSDHALEFTVTNISSTGGELMGLFNTYGILVRFNSRLQYRLDDANSNGGSVEVDSSQITDGGDHWVLINKITNDESNWEIYVDDPDTPVSTSNPTTGFGGVEPSISEEFGLYARNEGGGSFAFNKAADVGSVIRHGSDLSQSERQDRYNDYGWTA